MAMPMQGLRDRPQYEDLINVVVSDELYNIGFQNRDAKFLREGYVMSHLDGEGARIMEKQQEIASKQAFKESVLKEVAINTGPNLSDLRNEAHQEMRTDLIREFTTPITIRSRPETFDLTGGDEFIPFDTPSSPLYETPALSDHPSRINRRSDFDEQEEIQSSSRQQNKREQTIQEVSHHLDQSQPKRRVDVDAKINKKTT